MSENNLCQYKHGKLFLWIANWMYKLPLFVTSLGHHKFGNWQIGLQEMACVNENKM